jgi:long-chain acyl-CoA synthetase
VLESAVVGRPDTTYGELPVAFVQTFPGAQLPADELIEHGRRSTVTVPASRG